ncbi:uncharacterized protein [Chlorocebus sabaeus]|uniref:uncharacterized protein n=1 Tax=Chlorocebus sabaeus TaxID=60711 RepID=UPI003BF9A5E2
MTGGAAAAGVVRLGLRHREGEPGRGARCGGARPVAAAAGSGVGRRPRCPAVSAVPGPRTPPQPPAGSTGAGDPWGWVLRLRRSPHPAPPTLDPQGGLETGAPEPGGGAASEQGPRLLGAGRGVEYPLDGELEIEDPFAVGSPAGSKGFPHPGQGPGRRWGAVGSVERSVEPRGADGQLPERNTRMAGWAPFRPYREGIWLGLGWELGVLEKGWICHMSALGSCVLVKAF